MHHEIRTSPLGIIQSLEQVNRQLRVHLPIRLVRVPVAKSVIAPKPQATTQTKGKNTEVAKKPTPATKAKKAKETKSQDVPAAIKATPKPKPRKRGKQGHEEVSDDEEISEEQVAAMNEWVSVRISLLSFLSVV